MKKLLAIASLSIALGVSSIAAEAASGRDVAAGTILGGVAGYFIGNHNSQPQTVIEQPVIVAPVAPEYVPVEEPRMVFWVDQFGHRHYPRHH